MSGGTSKVHDGAGRVRCHVYGSTSLVAWVSARNAALGLPAIAGPTAEGVKKSVVQGLTETANDTWRANRNADEKKRTAATTLLTDRLRWKSRDNVK